jgi:vacuolar-type H+-ATPase subunit H
MHMSEKNTFLNWVGFKETESAAPNSVDRIRELESQLADLRSRRDVTSLSREEFEILATETAMTMIKSAQARESKAIAATERLIKEATTSARDAVETAENKARTILAGAESRGRKYLSAAESEAASITRDATREAQAIFEEKRQEATAIAQAARREGQRIISAATGEISNYRSWLSGVVSEAERLYRVQVQSLDAAQSAITQSRARLDSAFGRLADLQKDVEENLNADGTLVNSGPKVVPSHRAKPALAAPKSKKRTAKKSPTKRR